MTSVWLRHLFLLVGIFLYSAVVLTLDDAVLPAFGVNGIAQVTASTLTFLGPEPEARSSDTGWEARNRDSLATAGARIYRLWLRPFGIHRRGLGSLWSTLGSFALLAIVGAALLFLFPDRIARASIVLRAQAPPAIVASCLLGFVTCVLAYLLLRLSWLTIVGMPFIPVLISGVWLGIVFGLVVAGFTVGRALAHLASTPLPPLAEAGVGFWLIFVTGMVPYAGWLLGGIAACLGLGTLLMTRFGGLQPWNLDDLAEPGDSLPAKVVPLRRIR